MAEWGVSTNSTQLRVLKVHRGYADQARHAGFNQFDPVEGTESLHQPDPAGDYRLVSTNSTQLRVLKAELYKSSTISGSSFNQFDPVEGTERGAPGDAAGGVG